MQGYEVAVGLLLDCLAAAGRPAPSLPDLTRATLAAFYEWQIATRGAKPATARARVSAIAQAWRWIADSDEWGDVCPRPRTIAMPAPAARLVRAPTWSEMDAAVEAATGYPRRLLFVLRCTGLRVMQAMRLEWADVDLDRATLTIRPELGKSAAEKSGRRVPLAAPLASSMAGWGTRDGRLFAPRAMSTLRYHAVRAWEASGADPRCWRSDDGHDQPFHSFRKGYVSGLRRAGADPDAVEFLVGHSLGIRGIYTDPDALPLRAAVALVPDLGAEPAISALRARAR